VEALPLAWPLGKLKRAPTPLPPVLAVWMVELLPLGPAPLLTCVDQISMMSASPQVGQGTVLMLLPSVHHAGQRPWLVVFGAWMLATRIP
jgi:hypothetical protein